MSMAPPIGDLRHVASGLVVTIDLVGTFAFAVSGAAVGVRRRLDVFGVLVLAFVTATAGGIVRDLLVARTPVVLRSELYAVAALLGAGVVVLGPAIGASRAVAAGAGAVLCMALRLIAVRLHWNLPRSRSAAGDERR